MVPIHDLGAFLAVSAIVIMTPGQDTILTIRNSFLGGRRGGVATALGVVTGQAVWALTTSAGIAALLVAWKAAFDVIRVLGPAYLVWLGVQGILAAFRGRDSGPTPAERGPTGITAARAFRQGVLSNLGNPKMAVFFPSLLPQFAPEGRASFAVLLVLGLLFCTMTLAWLTAYSIAVARAGDFLRRSSIRRALDGIMGAVLVALGVRLAAEHR